MSGEPGDERGETLPLAERLRARIRLEGSITFREWMRAALYDEREGYYNRRDLTRWGRAGDYRTSPERTPLFAATFARHFAALYVELGSPLELTILEAGAGAGHFADRLLKTLQRDHTRVFSTLRYVVDERGEDARARAAELLAPFGDIVEFRRLDEVAERFAAGVIFSNELLDAFPVHRVVVRGGKLCELCVGLNASDDFMWIEREPSTPLLAEHFSKENISLEEGQIAEVNLEVDAWVARAASALARGYVVIVDYGAEAAELYGAPHRRGGTLRGYARHSFVENVLDRPGAQDLTTTINWTHVMEAGERAGLEVVSFERLDRFLMRAGILGELEMMVSLAETEGERAQLRVGARELILPGGMGESFQALVFRKHERLVDGR